MMAAHRKAQRGRPPGPATVAVPLRLLLQQKRDLDVLTEILDGHPPRNGLLQDAVGEYIERKLQDPVIRAAYDRRVNPKLELLRLKSARHEGRR